VLTIHGASKIAYMPLDVAAAFGEVEIPLLHWWMIWRPVGASRLGELGGSSKFHLCSDIPEQAGTTAIGRFCSYLPVFNLISRQNCVNSGYGISVSNSHPSNKDADCSYGSTTTSQVFYTSKVRLFSRQEMAVIKFNALQY